MINFNEKMLNALDDSKAKTALESSRVAVIIIFSKNVAVLI